MSYIVPIGPYHPALEEPIHAKLYTEGEVIKDAEVFVGYNHRGIEKLATERNAIQTLVLVERVCGICSHSHALTYAMAVEAINGVEVPKRGEYIRVITAELERLHSHLLWAGIACHIIGHDSLFMHIWDERELVMDLLEKLSGNRVNYAMVTIGGSRRDIDDDLRREILDGCVKLKTILDRIAVIATTDKTVAMRTKGVGVLPKADALRLGAVGPHARASGVDIDVRRDAPYCSYGDFDFDIPVVDDGDVFARVHEAAEDQGRPGRGPSRGAARPAEPHGGGRRQSQQPPGQRPCALLQEHPDHPLHAPGQHRGRRGPDHRQHRPLLQLPGPLSHARAVTGQRHHRHCEGRGGKERLSAGFGDFPQGGGILRHRAPLSGGVLSRRRRGDARPGRGPSDRGPAGPVPLLRLRL